MSEAMASRATIEQAKGMVMAARDVTADEAFEELRRLASALPAQGAGGRGGGRRGAGPDPVTRGRPDGAAGARRP